jgi:methylated-DNA-protein-cysteine methyltransferase-like protein
MGTGFFEAVYELVGRIPPGKVSTYGQIAILAGKPKAARLVGQALSRAPRFVPCHRVVNRRGELCTRGIFPEGMQEGLLRREGACFLPDGRLDFRRCFWSGG